MVTNIDAEHLDHWEGGLSQIVDAFVDFVNKVPFYGASILCLDHPTVQAMLPRIEKRFVTYGFSPQADYSASQLEVLNGAMHFTVRAGERERGRIRLNMIGRHNVLNALAAIAVADEVGVGFEACQQALKDFQGVARRFEIKGTIDDVMVVDDYGHHPEEIRATLGAAREAYTRRIVVAFQPHRYTRTRDLLDDFTSAFNACHVLVVSDIYAAGEDPIAGVDSEEMVRAIRVHGHQDVRKAGSVGDVATVLAEIVQPGDLVLTLGAGDIYQAGESLITLLEKGEVAGVGRA